MDLKEKIADHSLQLFSQYGMRSITMDDIAKGLGISKKTIYQYYADKDEIVYTATRRHLEMEYQQFEDISKISANAIEEIFNISVCISKNLGNVNPSILFELKKYYSKSWSLYEEFKEKAFKSSIMSTLQRGIDEGYFRSDLNAELLAIFRLEQLQMSFDQNIFPSSKFNFAELQFQMLELFLYGIFSDKGRLLYEQTKIKNSENHHTK